MSVSDHQIQFKTWKTDLKYLEIMLTVFWNLKAKQKTSLGSKPISTRKKSAPSNIFERYLMEMFCHILSELKFNGIQERIVS